MRTSKTTTARNLCAIDWVKRNPKGSSEDFAIYFDTLPEAELKKYQAREANAKSVKAAFVAQTGAGTSK